MGTENRPVQKGDGRNRVPPIYHPKFEAHLEAQWQAMNKRQRFELAKELYIKHMTFFGVSEEDAAAQFEGIDSSNVTKKEADRLFNVVGHILQALSHVKSLNRESD